MRSVRRPCLRLGKPVTYHPSTHPAPRHPYLVTPFQLGAARAPLRVSRPPPRLLRRNLLGQGGSVLTPIPTFPRQGGRRIGHGVGYVPRLPECSIMTPSTFTRRVPAC